MGKTTGFMDYQRKTSAELEPLARLEHFNEFHVWLPREEQQTQAARCMDCGVPFCPVPYTPLTLPPTPHVSVPALVRSSTTAPNTH